MLVGIVVALAVVFGGYALLHPRKERIPQSDLGRLRRLSDEMRRAEVHPFE